MRNEINLIIDPREKDIGIKVKRILPWAKKRMVGPFNVLDEMGPALLNAPKEQVDVRPHPHIGLSTLTYLLQGSLLHRDSLGYVQEILPGEVNWMTAGKGISHSERETTEARQHDRTLHGLQFWVALPKDKEDMDPTFEHYGKNQVPKIESHSSVIDVVGGSFKGQQGPLKAHSPLVFYVIHAKGKGIVDIPSQGYELALYIVKGTVKVGGDEFGANHMVVFTTGSDIEISHSEDALVAIIGGESFP